MALQRLGKYEIVALLGRGGMGEVHKARDPIIGRHVAIKTISAEMVADDWLRLRFEREAQSAGNLSHPNIVTIFDFGEAEGRLFIVMELLEGRDLKDLIGDREPFTLGAQLALMEQICDGLAFAHLQGFVHRDLKPANIHVLPDGVVKIMDFGLARPNSSKMTQVGAMLGTPHYMSPEQVRGETAEARSDVFSLGVVFYELLAGRRPFDADSVHSLLMQVLNETPEPLRERVPGLPAGLTRVLERAMAKEPAQRFAHAGEMREALRAVRAGLAPGEADRVLAPLPGEKGAVPAVVETVVAPTPPPEIAPAPTDTVLTPAVEIRAPQVEVEPPKRGWRRPALAALVFLVLGGPVALVALRGQGSDPAPVAIAEVAVTAVPEPARTAVPKPAPVPIPEPVAAPPTPAPSPVASAKPAASRPRPSATPEAPLETPPPAAPAAPEHPLAPEVRRAVKDFEQALVQRDLRRLRAMTAGPARSLEREVESATWQDLRLAVTGLEIHEDRATVRILWSQRSETGTVSTARTLELARSVLGWKISSIGR
jgi:eukaryotic-like serine/threonine-protein kinase